MWLDLAEMKLILEALEALAEARPDEPGGTTAARLKLRDYFREQVARVQKVSDEWTERHGAPQER